MLTGIYMNFVATISLKGRLYVATYHLLRRLLF